MISSDIDRLRVTERARFQAAQGKFSKCFMNDEP